LQGSTTGNSVYTETQSPTTNTNGLIAIEIGTGTLVNGSFANIDWANGPYFVKTETDPNGGSNYNLTGTSQFLSVPYALYAKNGLPSGSQHGQTLMNCDGDIVWTFNGQCPAKIAAFNCADTVHTGTLYNTIAASGTSSSITYTGGNGGIYAAQSITSTGVTGLTATLAEGTLNSGNGTLTLTISGTPNSSGVASFTLAIGNKTCILQRQVFPIPTNLIWPIGIVFCNGTSTTIVNVTNPVTGKTWMDRNLGASQAATSSTDAAAYGDLYQWGRAADGHQCRNSGTTSTISISDQPNNPNFILVPNNPNDWCTPQNDNLWQGVNGLNNPCPASYRIPTITELDSEKNSWSQKNIIGAFNSPLKLTLSGTRHYAGGFLNTVGLTGGLYSSTVDGNLVRLIGFDNASAALGSNYRTTGISIRCIKD
jgi:hypothetical protein